MQTVRKQVLSYDQDVDEFVKTMKKIGITATVHTRTDFLGNSYREAILR